MTASKTNALFPLYSVSIVHLLRDLPLLAKTQLISWAYVFVIKEPT